MKETDMLPAGLPTQPTVWDLSPLIPGSGEAMRRFYHARTNYLADDKTSHPAIKKAVDVLAELIIDRHQVLAHRQHDVRFQLTQKSTEAPTDKDVSTLLKEARVLQIEADNAGFFLRRLNRLLPRTYQTEIASRIASTSSNFLGFSGLFTEDEFEDLKKEIPGAAVYESLFFNRLPPQPVLPALPEDDPRGADSEALYQRLCDDVNISAEERDDIILALVTAEAYQQSMSTPRPETVFAAKNHLAETATSSLAKEAQALSLQFRELKSKLPDMATTKEPHYSWPEALDIILTAFEDFHPEFHKIASEILEQNRIYAVPDITGVMSDCPAPKALVGGDIPAQLFIMAPFDGSMQSMGVLAHELSHAVMFRLQTEQQPLINTPENQSTAYWEIFSQFGEKLVWKEMINRATNPEKRVALLTNLQQRVYRMASGGDCHILGQMLYDQARKPDFSGFTKDDLLDMKTQILHNISTPSSEEEAWEISKKYLLKTALNEPYFMAGYAFAEIGAQHMLEKYENASTEEKSAFANQWLGAMRACASHNFSSLLEHMDVDIMKDGELDMSPISRFFEQKTQQILDEAQRLKEAPASEKPALRFVERVRQAIPTAQSR